MARFFLFDGSQSWLFWLITIGALLVEAILAGMFVFFIWSHKTDIKEVTVSIDADFQRATRIEKLNSGKTNQQELKFAEVTHILVHGEEHGHRLDVTLESINNPSFQVNSDVFFDSQPMIEFGKKLGNFLQRPVIFKITDAGKPVSEETIQE